MGQMGQNDGEVPMERGEAAAKFLAKDRAEQIRVLAVFAHELTIVARDTYEVGGEGLTAPSDMRRINELQHRLTAAVYERLLGRLRYPDDVLLEMCLPEGDILDDRIAEAFVRTLDGATW